MAITNYTELKAAVASWLERDDLTSEIPDFITLADAEIRRDVRIREMLTRASITVNAKTISLPTGFAGPKRLFLDTSPRTTVQYISPQDMDRYSRDGTGRPKFYTIDDVIEFDVAPDQSYSGTLVHFAHVTALSDSNADNDVITNHPDIYLYGALRHAAPFLMEDERVQLWAASYEKAVQRANAQASKSMVAPGARPTVQGRGP